MKNRIQKNSKLVLIAIGAVLFTALVAAYSHDDKPVPYHSQEDMVKMMMNVNGLPVGDNGVFIGSGKCAGCHGIDPVGNANMTMEGEHVSPTENWRATMMANSAKDPLWLAKVAHEVSVNPDHEQELVNKCTSCHAPVGRYTHLIQGDENYSMELLAQDSLAKDGVNCGACHQQRMDNLGQHFSGELFYHTDTIWGPFVSEEMSFPIFEAAMTSFVGYAPVGNHKVAKSEFCAACHSLITETADLEGNLTGQTFIEQATYHEWLNSSFNSDGPSNQECQGCHMPRLEEPIVIASGYAFLPGREPFGQHWLVGGNTFMLNLMKNNSEALGLTASEQNFNTVIERTLDMLQNQSAEIEIIPGETDGDTARYTVKVSNLAGHKLPSGYPARRAYLTFEMLDENGNTIFHSGKPEVGSPYEVFGNDLPYEPHHDLITNEGQVQIYEMIMGDVNGNPTTVLERAATMLKDNRLVPVGFSTLHSAYDSTAIVGAASTDPNFNKIAGIEGTGTDEVRYHIPVSGINGNVTVRAKIYYQSVPPRWTEELFSVDHPTINAFEAMYWEEGPASVEMAVDEISSTLVGIAENNNRFVLGPNPTWNGWVTLQNGNDVVREIRIYDIRGALLDVRKVNQTNAQIQLPAPKGTYIVEIIADQRRRVEKVIRQ